MAPRLGIGIHRACCTIAAAMLLLGVYWTVFAEAMHWFRIDALLVIAVVFVWLLGRACRYLLAGD